MIGIGVFGILPLLYGGVYYFSDAWSYITSGDKEKLFVWQVT
jgi:Jagunal, ER re-organisation during oogenesis